MPLHHSRSITPAVRRYSETELRRLLDFALHETARYGWGVADREGLVGEALLLLWRAGTRVRKPQAWLRVVIRRLTLKTRQELRPLPLEGAAEPSYDPSATLLSSVAIAEAVRHLPIRQRAALDLHVQGLTGREIAARLGSTPKGVEHLLARARANLRAFLAG